MPDWPHNAEPNHDQFWQRLAAVLIALTAIVPAAIAAYLFVVLALTPPSRGCLDMCEFAQALQLFYGLVVGSIAVVGFFVSWATWRWRVAQVLGLAWSLIGFGGIALAILGARPSSDPAQPVDLGTMLWLFVGFAWWVAFGVAAVILIASLVTSVRHYLRRPG